MADVRIYKDCQGNIEIDRYYKESEIHQLKVFLESLGYNVIEVEKHAESFRKNKPFRPDKPCVRKKIVHEVDWYNPKVIFEILDSQKTDDLILKDIVKESGKVDIEKSNTSEMSIKIGSREISREYEKWKIENNIIETNENRRDLHKQFSKVYVALRKKKKQKRIQIGSRVYIQSEGLWGEIKDYNQENGQYVVLFKDGYKGWYIRKELELKEEK